MERGYPRNISGCAGRSNIPVESSPVPMGLWRCETGRREGRTCLWFWSSRLRRLSFIPKVFGSYKTFSSRRIIGSALRGFICLTCRGTGQGEAGSSYGFLLGSDWPFEDRAGEGARQAWHSHQRCPGTVAREAVPCCFHRVTRPGNEAGAGKGSPRRGAVVLWDQESP